jgi:hypothetical protein
MNQKEKPPHILLLSNKKLLVQCQGTDEVIGALRLVWPSSGTNAGRYL